MTKEEAIALERAGYDHDRCRAEERKYKARGDMSQARQWERAARAVAGLAMARRAAEAARKQREKIGAQAPLFGE